MVNPRAGSSTAAQAGVNSAYSLALLAEYSHTLDSLPLDVSRNIGDLRELDAVLSSSMINITAKIHDLTCMIEQRRGTKEERLWLLHEISEEAARLKYGGEDKIRVACSAADTVKAHGTHLYTLAERMPDFDVSLLRRKTVYPHVSDKSFMPLNMDTGRRRRGNAGCSGLLVSANTADPSPAKRKRVAARDDDIDIGSIRSPHKRDRVFDATNPRSRANRTKKTDRAPSPSESLVSVTSHLPSQNAHHLNGTSSARGTSSTHHNHAHATNASRATNGSNLSTAKRRGAAGQNSNNNRVPTPLSNDYPSHNPASSLSSHRAAGNGLSTANHHPASSSNLGPYANGTGTSLANGNAAHYYDNVPPHSLSGTPDLSATSAQLLAGPGVPFARSTSVHSAVNTANGTAGAGGRTGSANAANSTGGEGAGDEGDNDDGRTYCYCDSVSYGEMIACDDENCEREWFHLSCIGLTVCPEGSWYCDTCKNKRNNKRTGRGGKRRAAGSRVGGRA
ncbi:hypothetical protein AGABI1DRAFT_110792 [Agaricus bisporus var. burnettii JB137-S8]|uniref:Chromatin modification-related protein n=1 Tax=Agaricus bisporus var. burnettii (strain JB137-S8 / ATCC MYA-4627 / FGSC 10392) TaxID=597362 RepID=K5XLE6_AGABU|nr:uncharacterized protein AGABI1DRAFT_110792 [Agaricus bisporus var. burnettii JB137-S8]EKM84232.1 hypothetical protein AGABI1DRAFT_110792 [Agaricus bisporus var. burnettii JB137-S8]